MAGPDASEVQALFDAVRAACSAGIWSRGVELARAEAVSADALGEDEVRTRVAAPGVAVSPTATLYPPDEDWECDCASRAEVCEHVAAATIALRRSLKEGKALGAAAEAQGRVRYVLRPEAHSVQLERWVIGAGDPTRLRTSLEALARGRVEGPRVAATGADLAVEVALGTSRDRPLEPGTLARVLRALEGCDDVRIADAPSSAGERVRVSSEPVTPVVFVDDVPDGLRVSLGPDPSLTRRFGRQLALCGDVLRPTSDGRLDGREREELGRGRIYRFDEAAHLASSVLPSLRERMSVIERTEFLPKTTGGARPRVEVVVEAHPGGLQAMATLVYGNPAVARVDAGQLVPLSGPLPERDLPAEAGIVLRAERELELRIGHRVTLTGEPALALAARLRSWSGGTSGDAHQQLVVRAPLEPRFAVHEHGFTLDFESAETGASGAAGVEATAVLDAWQARESFVELPSALGGGLAPLPADWLKRYAAQLEDLLHARDAESGRVPPAALPELARLCDALEVERPPALGPLAALLEAETSGDAALPRVALSDALDETLRPYQREGVDWLALLGRAGLGALLADDMGLGKTLQTLCAIAGRTLVVAPTSVLHGWAREAKRFRPDLRVCTYHGSDRELDPEADLTLTSYAVLRLDRDVLTATRWDRVVLDEAQAIKNPDSQIAQAAYALDAHARIALTGTPVENRLEELWSQLHFLNPGLFGTRSRFRTRYAKPIAEGDAACAEALRERLHPFVLRRLKHEVARDLPPRSDVVLEVELSEAEREVYDAVAAIGRREVRESLAGSGGMMAALEALLRMRQAACDLALVPGQQARAPEHSSKLQLLAERLEAAHEDGHASLVFSQWTGLLDRAEARLEASGLAFTRLDGSTRDRAGVIDRFQSGEVQIMLVSLKAGGTGLNLTAADHIFLLDPWWNPAVEEQAASRAHRIGQTRPVVVHRLISKRTVEEGILSLHEHKRMLQDMALADAGAGITREDLLSLVD